MSQGAGSASVRASQLFNARGKKLVALPQTVTRSTQTSVAGSASVSMVSVASVSNKASSPSKFGGQTSTNATANKLGGVALSPHNQTQPQVQPQKTEVAEIEVPAASKQKDRTLFQRLFQRWITRSRRRLSSDLYSIWPKLWYHELSVNLRSMRAWTSDNCNTDTHILIPWNYQTNNSVKLL